MASAVEVRTERESSAPGRCQTSKMMPPEHRLIFVDFHCTNYYLIMTVSFFSFIRPSLMTMKVQGYDYEYYEARAEDVKLKDITSGEDNADILARLRDNDPTLEYFFLSETRSFSETPSDFIVREGDQLGWLGYFVSKSKQLSAIYIDDSLGDDINQSAFLEGLVRNRSIETLQTGIDFGESFKILVPFLRNNGSLHELNFHTFEIGLQCARNIAFLLGQNSSLKRLEIHETGLDDEGLVEIAEALRSQPQIEELRFNSNNIVRDGYVALGRALKRCLDLRELQLWTNFDWGHDDNSNNWLDALTEGLKHCHNLTSLRLDGNQIKEGSRSLSTLFQSDNCRLEELFLSEMNIDNDGASTLAAGLACLPLLTHLNLYDNSIGDQGLQALAEGLVNCNLEALDLSGNELTESVSGLRSLGALVRRSTNMHTLTLFGCSLTDEGLQSFVEGMTQQCNLTKLDLSCNDSITGNGWAYLSPLLRAEHCTLCTLSVDGINIDDDGAAALANGLVGNKSLTTLTFETQSITARGWAAFSRLLCDTSSVNNTYLSNHTLEEIGGCLMPDTPEDIVEYATLNKSHNQAAAICKILDSHPDIDVTPLFQWKMKCLPLVVEWLEKAMMPYLWNLNTYESTESTEYFQCRQLSAVYKFVRGMPQLVVDGYRRQKTKDVQSDAKKRKFDLTL